VSAAGGPAGTEAVPLVLVHGLFDTPRIFDGLRGALAGRRTPLLVPYLPHGLGEVPLETLAAELGGQIRTEFGSDRTIDLMGFSMGGVIARIWIQLQGGHHRTRRFTSVASPHRGTLTALPWPRRLLPGIADMRPGSPLLRRLDADLRPLARVDCCSFYCPTDLTVVPGWRAVLPLGERRRLPPGLHNQIMARRSSLDPLVSELLRR
jgi:triacylglycerol lipase